MQRTDVVAGTACAALGAFALVTALNLAFLSQSGTPGPGLFPTVLSALLVLFGALLAVSALRHRSTAEHRAAGTTADKATTTDTAADTDTAAGTDTAADTDTAAAATPGATRTATATVTAAVDTTTTATTTTAAATATPPLGASPGATATPGAVDGADPVDAPGPRARVLRAGTVWLYFAIAATVLNVVGFVLTTALLIAVVLFGAERRFNWRPLLVAILVPAGAYELFVHLLTIPLPVGLIALGPFSS